MLLRGLLQAGLSTDSPASHQCVVAPTSLICMPDCFVLGSQLCSTPTSGGPRKRRGVRARKPRPDRAAHPSGPQWFRSSGIPRDVTHGWRYASLNRSYCNLFSVQRGFFRETASHFLHLSGELKALRRHAEHRACASAGLLPLLRNDPRSFFPPPPPHSCNSLFSLRSSAPTVELSFSPFWTSSAVQLGARRGRCCRGASALLGGGALSSAPLLTCCKLSQVRLLGPPGGQPSGGMHQKEEIPSPGSPLALFSHPSFALQRWGFASPLSRLSHLGIRWDRLSRTPLRFASCWEMITSIILPPCQLIKAKQKSDSRFPVKCMFHFLQRSSVANMTSFCRPIDSWWSTEMLRVPLNQAELRQRAFRYVLIQLVSSEKHKSFPLRFHFSVTHVMMMIMSSVLLVHVLLIAATLRRFCIL